MHDWQYFFQPNPRNLDQGIYRIFDPEWKAEILHWFACAAVTKAQKEALIDALICFDDHCGDFFRYRAYFLAAEVIATFRDCSQANTIVDQLLKWSYAYCRTAKPDWKFTHSHCTFRPYSWCTTTENLYEFARTNEYSSSLVFMRIRGAIAAK